MNFNQICKNIKNLKIQGAENIAIAGVKALLIKHDHKSVKKLLSLRPTEPCLRNALMFSLKNIKKNPHLALKHFKIAGKKISEFGSKKIKNNSKIFTHCHSSNVVDVLKKAKQQGKKFIVNNTETRPLYQGRITAKELAKLRINIKHFVDSAGRIAIKESDLMLIGCDAITSEGKIINKIGSEMFCEIAKRRNTPVYVCTDSWKFDPRTISGYEEIIEERPGKEIWKNPPKRVKISNLAFEKINLDLITGIISEFGVYNVENFIIEVKKAYHWMLK